jgi:hypothetical protein
MQKSRVTAKLSLLEVFLNIVVKVNMGGTGDDHEFIVAAGQEAEGILAEIATVGLLAVNEQNRILDLSGPFSTNIAEFYLFLPS